MCSVKMLKISGDVHEIIVKVMHFPLIRIAHISGFSNCYVFKVLQ